MVYSRCGSGQVRTLGGACQDASLISCNSSCNGGTGEFLPTSGVCQCTNVPDLDTICNAACRASSTQLRFNSQTNTLESFNPVTGVSTPVPATDQANIFGTMHALQEWLHAHTPRNAVVRGQWHIQLQCPAVNSKRRRLAEAKSGIVNPMLCLQKGDSIMFSVSNQSYPVYAKDSLMNTNPQFDYGAFRTLDEKMKANTVAITADRHGDDARSNDIILAPDWGLIAGLLAALFGVVAGLIFGLYYFRRKSWVGKQAGVGGYKEKARGFNLSNLTSKGSIVKKNAKPVTDIVPSDDLEAKAKTPGEYQPELNRWDGDDLGIRELVDRLQFHHDSVEKSFHDQEAGAVKMMKLLQRLLASIVVAQSSEKDAEGCDAELVLVESLERSAAARAEFEAQQCTAEGALLVSANCLAATVQDKGIVSTIIDEMVKGNGSSPLLQAITTELHTLTQAITSTTEPTMGVWPILQSEQNRRKVDAAVWNAFGKTTRDLLSPELLQLKQSCNRHASECDERAAEVCESLLKFSNVAPSYMKKLEAFQEACALEIKEALEQQNPALIKPLKQKQEKGLQTLLKELQVGASKLVAKIEADQKQLNALRTKFTPDAIIMQRALADLKNDLTLAKAATNPANDVAELVAQLRTLLSNPGQFQLMAPAVAPTLNLDAMFAETETMAEVNVLHGGDMAELQQLMDDEVEGDAIQDELKAANMRNEFISELNANTSLTEEDRQILLDEFNEDMAQLEASLCLERHKQEEHLRNRLAIRKLKKHTESNLLLEDQALKAAMREKQELELKELERTFAEEQAKIEQEFQTKLDSVKQKSSQLLVRGNTQKRINDVDDESVSKAIRNEFNAKWNERQRLLEDENARAKAKLNARKKASERVHDVVADELQWSHQWSQVKPDKLTPELLHINTKMKMLFETEREQLERCQVQEKAQLGTLSTDDEDVLNQLQERLKRRKDTMHPDDEEATLMLEQLETKQAALDIEIDADAVNTGILADKVMLEALTTQDQDVINDIKAEALKAAKLVEKAQLGTISAHEMQQIEQLHDDLKKSMDNAKAEIDDEEARLRGRLRDRLARIAKSKDDAAMVEKQVEAEAAAKKTHDELSILVAKAESNPLTSDDDETIRKVDAIDYTCDRLKAKRDALAKQQFDTPAARAQALAQVNDEERLQLEQVEHHMDAKREQQALQELQTEAQFIQLQSPNNDDEAIAKVQQFCMWNEKLAELEDEAKRRRQRLHDRLAAKRKHVEALPLLDKQEAEKELKLEEARGSTEIEQFVEVTKERLGLEQITEKAKLNLLTPDDEALIKEVGLFKIQKCQVCAMQLDAQENVDMQQIEEMADLKRHVLAEEAKVEAQLLTQLNTPPNYDDDIDRLQADYAKRSKEREAWLKAEEARMRQHFKIRLAKRLKLGDPATPDEVEAMEQAVEREISDMRCQAEVEALSEKQRLNILSNDDEDLLQKRSKNKASDLSPAERDVIDRQLDVEENVLSKAADDHLVMAKQRAMVAKLLEKKLIGVLTPDDEELIRQIQDNHQKLWGERKKALEDEAARRKNDVRDRLAARKLAKTMSSPEEIAALESVVALQEAAETLQVDTNLSDELQELSEKRTKEASQLDKLDAPPNYDDDISRAEHERMSRERRRLLEDEEARLRSRLKDRLSKRRKLGETITGEEMRDLEVAMTAEIQAKRAAVEIEILADKAKKNLLTSDDEEMIRKVDIAKVAELEDEAKRRKQHLQDRLSKKRAMLEGMSGPEKHVAAAVFVAEEGDALAELAGDLENAKNQLMLNQVTEKASLNMLTPDDSDVIKKV
ncbi:hypothetical protein DYB32_001787 [Aphanomyces invadans]|uniref:Uncharacterized protein n=1 Tax=Aphanomyces invadans TaxID=157072 RepID=A0A418B4U2_9STRA|nr:hypothetical protein DYB32_001787 [Aphanomyces invadans]